jgi:hypothetical protein
MAEYLILSEPLREELKALIREVLAEGNGNGHHGSPLLENDLLRNIANTLDVDAIVGFRVGHGVNQGVVCWNCIRSADEPRRFDVVYDPERVICARCKEGLIS